MELELTRDLYIAFLKTSMHFGIIWLEENLTKRLFKTTYRSFRHMGNFGSPLLAKVIIYVNIYECPNRMEVWIAVRDRELVKEIKNWIWFKLYELHELNMSYREFGILLNEYFYKKVL